MYLLLFPNCSENLQQKTFNSGILQSCTFQDLTLGRLMAFLRSLFEDFFFSYFLSPSLKAHWFPLLALGKVSDGAQRLHVHCKLRRRRVLQLGSWSSFGELSIRELRTRPILYVGGVFPSPVSKSYLFPFPLSTTQIWTVFPLSVPYVDFHSLETGPKCLAQQDPDLSWALGTAIKNKQRSQKHGSCNVKQPG